ncbi:MAG: DUF4132 domain-containing protein [Lachnospiraceae bacterium]|nr:DUF4132 domain-containing protein [Lachnospiraceae bacterium]
MADFTYQTRSKLREIWVSRVRERAAGLTAEERALLPGTGNGISQKSTQWMTELLQKEAYRTLSALYKARLSGLVDVCVPKGQQEEFYYALDEMNQFQFTAGWYRRSVRSKSYVAFVRPSVWLLWAYSRLDFYGGSLAKLLTGEVPPEIYDHARTEYWQYSGILAAQLDRGNEGAKEAVEQILLGEGNTAMISRELILGIIKSRREDMYKLLGDFLLAARLQEGARQAVCESMDAGRPEAFLSLFKVIEDNNLVRYSSIKRSVATWIGIFNENSVDRLTDKLVRLMGQCVRDKSFCMEQLKTNDSIAISCALWGLGFYDAQEAIDAELAMIRCGTKNQKMTASYFNRSLQSPDLKMQAAKEVLLQYSDDYELAACFMPSFMAEEAGWKFRELLKSEENGRTYSLRDDKAVEPKKVAPEELFADAAEARRLYDVLMKLYEGIPKKGLVLDPCIFPWYQVSLSRSDLAVRICYLAWMLQDPACLNEAAALIPTIGQGQTYGTTTRAAAARVLLYRPDTPAKKEILFELLHNPEEWTMNAAFRLVEDMELTDGDYEQIEKNLKYKKGRSQTLALLKRQGADKLRGCIGRLLKEKSEECHMGALELAMRTKKENEAEFAALKPLLQTLTEPTAKEQVLLKELVGEGSEAQEILNTPGYGLYDPEREWTLPPVKVDGSEAAGLFSRGEAACIRALTRLNELIEKNQTREYTNAYGDELLLGTRLDRCRWRRADTPELKPLDEYPFRELWEGFYKEEIQTPGLLMELCLYEKCRRGRGAYEKNLALYKKAFGKGLLKKPPFKELVQGLRFGAQASIVVDALFRQYVPDSLLVHWGLIGTARLLEVMDDAEAVYQIDQKRWNGTIETVKRRAAELPIFNELRSWLGLYGEEDWDSAFTLRFRLQERYNRILKEDKEAKSQQGGYIRSPYLSMRDYVKCWKRGFWDKEQFYKAAFTLLNIGELLGPVTTVEQKGALSFREARPADVDKFFGSGRIKRVEGKYRFDTIGDEMPEMAFAHEMYRELVPLVLAVELVRGEQETPFSFHISSIRVVYGIDTLVRILNALGQDTLYRSNYAYGAERTSRRVVLSHLLKVCRPAPGETAADLKKALKGSSITKKRLVEVAMYAEQWIPIFEEYLKVPGFQSGCYYFMAHTSERMDEFVTSMVAKYTPLSPEELKDGAFDIHWFSEAYEKLGEKDFKLLYDAAKYSSSGAAHARARKYADAARGNVTFPELAVEITAKRNKDLLMSLGLLPLSKDRLRREDELLERYQFIQRFKKESKSFGAQRRASEGRAVELALRNLSVNAGFTDVMRLTLRMETKLTENLDAYLGWTPICEGGAQIRLSVDETGKAALLCQKDGKALKSVPAKEKKNPLVLEYQEMNKKLKEQYSRTRLMLEQAMEDRTAFEAWELLALMENPVVRPILEPLVLMTAREEERRFGFLTESGLEDRSGARTELSPEETLLIAHPFDLYQNGDWQDWQKLLFERRLLQPFKQVFRELYVKLPEELKKEHSLMFAGNQIQPQKTAGALKSRRWVADYEDGLQKIYYKENIVARIYAMADWFSPSDIEAPTLEYVVFTNRKTFETLKIEDIPNVIYSEVMRDVDLAVSVAHAGGVDPETSHSTVEMRRAIVRGNLELFGIKNVCLEGSHAVIDGRMGRYTVHLGSGVVHQLGNAMLYVVPVHSQKRGRLFLPFVDDDPKTAEILSKILLFAEDTKIKDPSILSQIR